MIRRPPRSTLGSNRRQRQMCIRDRTKTLIIEYTVICFISMIARILIYRHAYYLSFSRGAEMCGDMRLDLANHYRSLSLGHFQKNSSGYLLSTLTKDLSSFELIITHTLPSVIKTAVTAILILLGTFFIDWKLALLECLVSVSYTHLTLPTIAAECRSRWSPYH